jgi:hypothetical protein
MIAFLPQRKDLAFAPSIATIISDPQNLSSVNLSAIAWKVTFKQKIGFKKPIFCLKIMVGEVVFQKNRRIGDSKF